MRIFLFPPFFNLSALTALMMGSAFITIPGPPP